MSMRFFIISVATFIFMALPMTIFAWAPGQPIVPQCYGSPNGPYCQACDFMNLINNLLAFAVYFSAFVATIMFAYAGFLYVTAASNQENLTKAKSIFGKVLLGFFFVLTAWLLIDIVLSVFTNKSFGFWTSINCAAQPTLQDASPTTIRPGGSATPVQCQPGDTQCASHNNALLKLNSAGVTVTSTRGPDGVQANCSGSGCTSLQGIRNDTVDQVINFKKAVGGEVVVTAATEGGVHSAGEQSHGTGYKVDIDDTPAVNAYITENFTNVGVRGDGATLYQDQYGNTFARESNHWDVTVVKTGAY